MAFNTFPSKPCCVRDFGFADKVIEVFYAKKFVNIESPGCLLLGTRFFFKKSIIKMNEKRLFTDQYGEYLKCL